MGFFSDLGNGIASIVKAPFEAVGSLAAGVGQGIGSILHGSSNCQQPPQQYMAGQAQQCQQQDPMMALQMFALQQALMMHMALCSGMYPPAMCGGGMYRS